MDTLRDESVRISFERVDSASACALQCHDLGKHIFYAAFQGCSCGFLGDDPATDRPSLRLALVGALASSQWNECVRLFLCWEGEEGDLPEEHRSISIGNAAEVADCIGSHPGWGNPTLISFKP